MDSSTLYARKALFYCALLAAIVLPLELFSFVYLGFSTGQWRTPQFYFQNHFAQQQSEGCWWADSLMPHPYLSFGYHRGEPCSQKGINNISLKGPAFPGSNDPEFYDILVVGGSVAELFTAKLSGSPNFLEKRLNDLYVSPNKKPFRILNGAIAAGRGPMQVISLLLHADRADAVFSLEGYNEFTVYQISHSLLGPAQEWKTMMASYAPGGGARHSLLLATRGAANFAARNLVLSHSYTAFLFTRLAYAAAEKGLRSSSGTSLADSAVPEFPEGWSEKERRREFMRQYRRLLHQQRALAREQKLPYFAFIQPAPGLFKRLTDQERSVVGDVSYGAMYQGFAEELLALKQEGFPIAGLLKLLLSVEDSIYVDNIHFRGDGTMGKGNALLAEAVADILAKEWRLARRK